MRSIVCVKFIGEMSAIRAVLKPQFSFHLRPLIRVRPDVRETMSTTTWDATKFRKEKKARLLNEENTFSKFLNTSDETIESTVTRICEANNVEEFLPLQNEKFMVCTELCEELDVQIPSFALGSFTDPTSLSDYLKEQRLELRKLIDSRNIAYPDNVSFE